MWQGYITAEAYTRSLWSLGTRRRVRCGAAARGALGRGVVHRPRAGVVGVAGPREVERALLEADDAVDDVLGVRVDGRAVTILAM